MQILRRFAIPGKPILDDKQRPAPTTLYIEECEEPNAVRVTVNHNSLLLTKEAFETLIDLGKYSSYGDNIKFVSEPAQADLDLT